MASKNLPINIDSTYADDPADPSVQIHQALHDDIAEVVNLFDYDALDTATAGYYLYVDPATGLISVIAPPSTVDVNLQTGTAYTLLVTDNGKIVERSNAAACTVTVPAGVFSAGMQVGFTQVGAGTLSFVEGAGFDIVSEGNLMSSRGQWAEFVIRFRSASQCVLSGGLA